MSISEPFIRRPVMTMVVALAAIVFGVLAYFKLPVAALPNVSYPVITITAAFPGMDPQTMGANVAAPLEQQLMQIQGLTLMTSQNTQGQTQIVLQFDISKDITRACAEVQAAITRAQPSLPNNMPTPPQYQITNPNDFPFLIVALASSVVPESQMYDAAYSQVAQRLSMVEGISNVQVWGAMRAVRIQVDTQKLYNRGLTMQDVTKAVEKGSVLQSTGQLEGPDITLIVRPRGQLNTAAEYGELIIAHSGGAPVFLKDVAKCVESTNNLYYYNLFYSSDRKGKDQPIVIGMSCTLAANTNMIEVTNRALAVLEELKPTLPGGLNLFVPYMGSVPVKDSITDVEHTLWLAFGLVVIIIFLFLGRIVHTIIPVIALPLSMLVTFIVMSVCGFSLDNLSLLALTLAIGFLVDDAIVFLENMTRHVEAGERGAEATLASAREISTTIFSMTLTLSVVFLPLLFMGGQLGRIFREFSVTIIVAILASGLISLTVTPMMCSRIIGARDEKGANWLERRARAIEDLMRKVYRSLLSGFLRVRWMAVLIWVGSLFGAAWLYNQLPKTFLPPGDSGLVRGVFLAPDAVAPAQIQGSERQILEIVKSDPAVKYAFSLTGRGDVISPNQGIVFYVLQDRSQRSPIADVNQRILNKINAEVPGVNPLLNPIPVLNLSTGATPNIQGQYAYSISGLEQDVVLQTAMQMEAAMRKIHGFVTVSSDIFPGSVQLKIDVNRKLASAYGITMEDVENVLGDAYSQNYVYKIKTPIQQYQVIVEASNRFREVADNLNLLYLKAGKDDAPTSAMTGSTQSNAPSGGAARMVPFSAVASWKQELTPLQVNHINSFPSATIYFNLAPGFSASDATSQLKQLGEQIVPAGLVHSFQGQAQVFDQLASAAGPLTMVAVFVMFVILAILYESYMHPLTVLSALPVATVGGFLTLYLFKAEFSLYAFVGMFMLMGIVVKNGIMMIDFAIQRQEQGMAPFEAVIEACLERLRPILMTTLAAIFGALPMALAFGNDGDSRQPLGLVIVGGLIVAQFLTLFVTPALYLILEAFQRRVLDKVPLFARGTTTAKEAKVIKTA